MNVIINDEILNNLLKNANLLLKKYDKQQKDLQKLMLENKTLRKKLLHQKNNSQCNNKATLATLLHTIKDNITLKQINTYISAIDQCIHYLEENNYERIIDKNKNLQ